MSNNQDLPPSYEDVLKEDYQQPPKPPQRPPQQQYERPPAPPQRPPSMPPRPSVGISGGSSGKPTRPKLPWTYPKGYYCTKCGNTGYKIKNGHSCKKCWRKFAPLNSPNNGVQIVYGNVHSGYNPAGYPVYMPPQQFQQPGMPLILKPGDPRIGGVLCGECRGTGRIRFILDEKICPLCSGVGRIM